MLQYPPWLLGVGHSLCWIYTGSGRPKKKKTTRRAWRPEPCLTAPPDDAAPSEAASLPYVGAQKLLQHTHVLSYTRKSWVACTPHDGRCPPTDRATGGQRIGVCGEMEAGSRHNLQGPNSPEFLDSNVLAALSSLLRGALGQRRRYARGSSRTVLGHRAP